MKNTRQNPHNKLLPVSMQYPEVTREFNIDDEHRSLQELISVVHDQLSSAVEITKNGKIPDQRLCINCISSNLI